MKSLPDGEELLEIIDTAYRDIWRYWNLAPKSFALNPPVGGNIFVCSKAFLDNTGAVDPSDTLDHNLSDLEKRGLISSTIKQELDKALIELH